MIFPAVPRYLYINLYMYTYLYTFLYLSIYTFLYCTPLFINVEFSQESYANPTLFILLSLYVIEFSLAWNSHTWFYPTTLVISTLNSPKKIFKPISTKSSNFLKLIFGFVIYFRTSTYYLLFNVFYK